MSIAGDPGYVYPSVAEVHSEGRSLINVFGYTQWENKYIMVPVPGEPGMYEKEATFFAEHLLPQWSGYLIIIVFSLFFAAMAWFLMWVEMRFAGVKNNAEQVNPHSRTPVAAHYSELHFSHVATRREYSWARHFGLCYCTDFLDSFSPQANGFPLPAICSSLQQEGL